MSANPTLGTKKQELLLKALVFGYAEICVNSKKADGEIWYEQAKQVRKYFSKRKAQGITKSLRIEIDAKYKELIELDRDFFKDGEEHSPYVSMLLILNHLIIEMRDIEMRLRFGHFNTERIVEELETTDYVKKIGSKTNRYMTKLLEVIGD